MNGCFGQPNIAVYQTKPNSDMKPLHHHVAVPTESVDHEFEQERKG